MAACTDPQTASEILIAYGPIITSVVAIAISIGVAVFTAKSNTFNANEAMRLGLYQRRIALYNNAVNAYRAWIRLAWDPDEAGKCISIDNPKLRQYSDDLSDAVRESEFLFKNEHGITEILRKIHLDLKKEDYSIFAPQAVEANLNSLHEKIEPYLAFRQIGE